MTTYVMRRGRLVNKVHVAPKPELGIYVISDEMEATRHMADNKFYTSKHRFREATRAAGCVEVGNETATLLKPRRATMPTREQRRAEIRSVLRRQLAGHPY